ncbi:MAG: 4-(cytidine 5'-diphospho)-2-C-methyl-D-erythritol kinase [Planctomycetota bacterium]|nr:MAG: 4-(cytidine 5'-diphospho)-2-C-methyl-D-erythritol kinase [Planctomycetota bacterium]
MARAGGEMATHSAGSPAKVNLTLAVRPRRADGFHPIESLVALLDFCDRVTIEPADRGRLEVVCDDPGVPIGDDNLVVRAARRLAAAADIEAPAARIRIEKRIPMGAGLGGGSSNAATTLRLLNQLWGLHWSVDRLSLVAQEVGADVPLFLRGVVSFVSGRGEHVQELAAELRSWVVLILPDIHADTAAVYRRFDRLPPPPRCKHAALLRMERIGEAQLPDMFNDLEPAAFDLHPPLRELHARAERLAARPVRMSGSGSALYTLVDEAVEARRLADAMASDLRIRVAVVAAHGR